MVKYFSRETIARESASIWWKLDTHKRTLNFSSSCTAGLKLETEPLINMREVIRILKRRGPSKIFCPKCGSPDIQLSSRFLYGVTPRVYVCRSCGYNGPIVMELEKEENTE
jgi:predicted RNA-binding Zn-ribbon protein involved in translation (DUF1610 family)